MQNTVAQMKEAASRKGKAPEDVSSLPLSFVASLGGTRRQVGEKGRRELPWRFWRREEQRKGRERGGRKKGGKGRVELEGGKKGS